MAPRIPRALALAALLAAPAALALAGPLGGPVTMSAITGFTPPVVAVTAGGSVTWQNTDFIGHTVTSVAVGSLDSGLLEPGEGYTATFPAAGVFPYQCKVHPYMAGVVVVA